MKVSDRGLPNLASVPDLSVLDNLHTKRLNTTKTKSLCLKLAQLLGLKELRDCTETLKNLVKPV